MNRQEAAPGAGGQPGVGVQLDVTACRRWIALALTRLAETSAVIDALNVYPVPDGDTGTNLLLTLRRAAEETQVADPSVASLTAAMADGALLGARGNSGIITAQMLTGCAEAFARYGSAPVDGPGLAAALLRADELAWAAVELPVEGTVLSVTRAVAEALRPVSGPAQTPLPAGAIGASQDPVDALSVARLASSVARAALAATTEQLPALREAAVVDAGAAGYVLLLDAMVEALAGAAVGALPGIDDVDPATCAVAVGPRPMLGPAYEVMFVLADLAAHATPEPAAALRQELAALGDSVVVAGLGPVHVHVHSDDPRGVLAVGRRFGAPVDVRVVHLATGSARPVPRDLHTPGSDTPLIGCVAWASGPGLAGLLADAGVTPVVSAAAKRISTEEVVAAIEATGAIEVIVLPNDADSLPVARAATARVQTRGVHAEVLETFAEVQGLAAVAVFDPAQPLADLLRSMSAAAAGIRHGAVAVAGRAASTPGGPCRAGDALGLVGGEIVQVGRDVAEMTGLVLTELLAGHPGTPELVTLVLGVGVPAGVVEKVELLTGTAQLEVLAGGQQTYPVLLGVE